MTSSDLPGRLRQAQSRHDLLDLLLKRHGTEIGDRTLPYQVSVRREATHIRASGFGLLKLGQGAMKRIRRGGPSHEASDDFQLGILCLVRSHDCDAAVSFDRAPHPDRRQFGDGFFGMRYATTGAVTNRWRIGRATACVASP